MSSKNPDFIEDWSEADPSFWMQNLNFFYLKFMTHSHFQISLFFMEFPEVTFLCYATLQGCRGKSADSIDCISTEQSRVLLNPINEL